MKKLLATLFCLAAVPAFSQEITITAADRCAGCEMTILGRPGGKGCFVHADGAHSKFCSVKCMFRNMPQGAGAAWVQDMASTPWKEPQAAPWVKAGSAWFVVGSRVKAPMGSAVASFGSEEGAKAFAAREGGRIVRFGEARK